MKALGSTSSSISHQSSKSKCDDRNAKYTHLFITLIGMGITIIGSLVLGGIGICNISNVDALLTVVAGSVMILSSFLLLAYEKQKEIKTKDDPKLIFGQNSKTFPSPSIAIVDATSSPLSTGSSSLAKRELESATEVTKNSKKTEVHAEVPLFFWDARPRLGFSNFGDAMSVNIVERILGRTITTTTDSTTKQKKLLAIGSIVNYAQEGDVLWGTGVNGKYAERSSYHFNNLDIRAVRGPLSRRFLMEMGIDCPEIYGDPTLLLPRLFPEFQKPSSPTYDYIVIPHFSDEHLFRHLPNMVSVKEDWQVVVAKILNSKFVISSALSGVIVAEAFGIPARLIIAPNETNTETIFKYSDYYCGTNRFKYRFANSIEDALEMSGEPMPVCDLDRLLQAFPYDLFRKSI